MGVFRASAASSKAEMGKERGEALGRRATNVLSCLTIVFSIGAVAASIDGDAIGSVPVSNLASTLISAAGAWRWLW